MTTPYIDALVRQLHRMADLADAATCDTVRNAATERVRQLRVEIQRQRYAMRTV